jgi:hypothetical protein
MAVDGSSLRSCIGLGRRAMVVTCCLAAACVLAFAAPARSQDADPVVDGALSVSLGQPFELSVGRTATISETGLQVGFHGVLEDSRCPAGVACVWAGQVIVELEVWGPDEASETFTLSSCCPQANVGHHVYAGQAIDLLAVGPARQRPGDVISQDDYRLEIAINALH